MFRILLYKLIRRTFFPLLGHSALSIKLKWIVSLHLIEPYFFDDFLTKQSDKYSGRLNPDKRIEEFLAELVTNISSNSIKILDIGAGPITMVGYKLDNKVVELIPIDPLAKVYNRILKRKKINPPVKTINGNAEKLSKQFNNNEFDLVYANNSLDHSANPLKAFSEIYKILKPNCYFNFSHFTNEGEINNYYGLHQWNFYVRNDCLFLANKTKDININISEEFKNCFSIEIAVVKRRINARFKKLI